MPPASPSALAIAQAVAAAPGLRLGGLHVYHGGIQHVRTTDDRRAAVANGPAAAARATAAQLRAAGLEVPVVTGAGTGISPLELEPGRPLTKLSCLQAPHQAFKRYHEATHCCAT